MKPDAAAFLSWATNLWNEQRFNLVETPAKFAARDPHWFLKELAREWNGHRKALFDTLKPERAKLEARCAELANTIGLAVGDVRKHRFRSTYTDCADLMRVNGKLSRAKLRPIRTRNRRSSTATQLLVTFSDQWTSTLAHFAKKPLERAPIEVLGFPLDSREVPDLAAFMRNVPAVRGWSWGLLYPPKLLETWNLKDKWPAETPWPLVVWGNAFERMLTTLGQLHSAVAVSPWSMAHALDLTFAQPALCDYLGVQQNDAAAGLAGWQLQLQGRYKGWLAGKLGSGNAKHLSHVYPVGSHAIKWHKGSDSERLIGPMASTLQATSWFVAFLLHGLANRPMARASPTIMPTKRRRPPKGWRKHALAILNKGDPITMSELARRVGVAKSTIWRDKELRGRCLPEPRHAKGFFRANDNPEAFVDE